MKSAPANVEPNILSLGFDLNAFERIGKVPTKHTIAKNNSMNTTFKMAVI